jgi:DNA-binding MarR family transcriptional regulator
MNHTAPGRGTTGLGFLLAQVGGHAAAKFAERLAPLDLVPAHAGILRLLSTSAGLSQQELASRLGIHPSRLVAILDDLEARRLVERRQSPSDRRSYAIHLSEAGNQTLKEISRIARQHTESVCAALDESERQELASLLQRIADQQGLRPGVHPGYARLGRSG